MESGASFTVWINEADARVFLGLDPAKRTPSSTVDGFITGKYQRDEPPAGFWMPVESVSRRSAMGAVTERYVVKPAD
jgi:hypothetical protein